MTAKPLQISLGLLNALQVAIAAAAGFAAAVLIVVPAAQPGASQSTQETVGLASRAYVAAITARLRQTVDEARNAALALRDEEGLLSADQRVARLRAWLALNPVYRDALLVAPDGTVLMAGDEGLVGGSGFGMLPALVVLPEVSRNSCPCVGVLQVVSGFLRLTKTRGTRVVRQNRGGWLVPLMTIPSGQPPPR